MSDIYLYKGTLVEIVSDLKPDGKVRILWYEGNSPMLEDVFMDELKSVMGA